jgi:tRNA(Ile)-lysidine synthase
MALKIEKEFSQIIYEVFGSKLPKKITVAVSGGLDSMALLLLFKNIYGKKIKIICLTVDHNVRKDSAADAKFVANFCAQNSIDCSILKSYLKNSPEVDIEGSLREVRYNLLTDFCQKNKIENLFLAHHKQDLAENFLIRLFRGSGIDGLSAMPTIRHCEEWQRPDAAIQKLQIIRPLLDFSKSDLEKYLQIKKAAWVEDESNEDINFLRNKIRKFLQTLPDFDAINDRIALASQAILEAKKILAKETKKNFPKIFKAHTSTRHPDANRDPSSQNVDYGFNRNDAGKKQRLLLDLEKFIKLEKPVATRYLALALMQVANRHYKPRREKLTRIYQLIVENKLNKKTEFYGCELEKLNEQEILISKKLASEK